MRKRVIRPLLLSATGATVTAIAMGILLFRGEVSTQRGQHDYGNSLPTVNCGVACVSYLLAYHRIQPPQDVRVMGERYVDGENSISLADLKRLCTDAGLGTATALQVSWEDLSDLPTPFILHLKRETRYGHFIICTAVASDRLQLVDPLAASQQLFVLPRAQLEEQFDGYVLLVSPNKSHI